MNYMKGAVINLLGDVQTVQYLEIQSQRCNDLRISSKATHFFQVAVVVEPVGKDIAEEKNTFKVFLSLSFIKKDTICLKNTHSLLANTENCKQIGIIWT